MENEYQLLTSHLSRNVTDKGHTVRLEIYRGIDTDWTLEAVDEFNNSTVWDDLFPSDQAALDEALRTITDEGIETLVGSPSGTVQ